MNSNNRALACTPINLLRCPSFVPNSVRYATYANMITGGDIWMKGNVGAAIDYGAITDLGYYLSGDAATYQTAPYFYSAYEGNSAQCHTITSAQLLK